MNPRRVWIYIDAYNSKTKRDFEFKNVIAHLQGQYVCEALLSTVGNMFAKKGSKPIEYPKKPYEFGKDPDSLSEEELQKQRELFVATLMAKQANFELTHKKPERQEE